MDLAKDILNNDEHALELNFFFSFSFDWDGVLLILGIATSHDTIFFPRGVLSVLIQFGLVLVLGTI